MNIPLQELIEERDITKSHLIAVEKAIARHPETIKKSFNHNPMWDTVLFDELVSKVSFVRPSTITAEEGKSFFYVFNDKIYRVRYKDKEVFCHLDQTPEEPISAELIESLWNQEDPITFLQGSLTDWWKIVGCLLLVGRKNED